MLRIKECKALARRTLLGRYGIVIAAYFITIAIKVMLWVLTAISGGMTLLCAGVFGGMLKTGIAFSFPRLVCGVMLTMFLLVATIIVSLWFEIGSTKLVLNICRGVKSSVGDVFYGFKEGSNTLCFIMTGVALGFIIFVINAVQKLLYLLAGKVLANQTGAHIAAVVIITVISLLIMWYVSTAFMFAKIIIADKRESTIGGALKASRRLMKGRKLKGFWLLYFSFLFWDILMLICGPAALWISPYIVCTTVIFYMDADGTLWQLPGEGSAPDEANVQELEKEDSQSEASAVDDGNTQGNVNVGEEDAPSDTITEEPVHEDNAHPYATAENVEESAEETQETTASEENSILYEDPASSETEPAQQATANDSENTQQDTAAASLDTVSKIPEAQAAAPDVQNEIEQPEESVNDDTKAAATEDTDETKSAAADESEKTAAE